MSNKKQKRRYDCSLQRFCFSFQNTEVFLEDVGNSRMYTFELPILYSEESLRRAFSGQNPSCLHIPLRYYAWFR